MQDVQRMMAAGWEIRNFDGEEGRKPKRERGIPSSKPALPTGPDLFFS